MKKEKMEIYVNTKLTKKMWVVNTPCIYKGKGSRGKGATHQAWLCGLSDK